jgi:putative PIN family toxin of toxin-antitoxin system
MRVVLDSNIIVSRFLSPHGLTAQILDFVENERLILVVSEPILTEYQEALMQEPVKRRHGMSDAEIKEAVQQLTQISILVVPTVKVTVVTDDPDDNKFLECALAGNALYVISRDPHLLTLEVYNDIRILRPHIFLELLTEEEKAA